MPTIDTPDADLPPSLRQFLGIAHEPPELAPAAISDEMAARLDHIRKQAREGRVLF